MKIWTFILLLIITFFHGKAQTEVTVKQLFFNLPLDSPREKIYNALCIEKKFLRKDLDSISSPFDPYLYTYLGSCSEQSFISARADSIEIELTFGSSTSCSIKKKKGTKYGFDVILRLRYYFKSADTVENEYNRISALLKPIFRDISFIFTDTIFSDVPERRLFKSKGLFFKSDVACYSVELSNASINAGVKGLFLEYRRKEKGN